MLRYFDRTFFKFLLGFAGMIALSMLVLVAVGYYEVEVKSRVESQKADFSLSQVD